MRLLNIAAGKFLPEELPNVDPYFLVNLDTMYYSSIDPKMIELKYSDWNHRRSKMYYCNSNAFEFMEKTKLLFNTVCVYRFLEHITFTQVSYFIYLLSTITEKTSLLDIIVPDYTVLAHMILNEDIENKNFESHNIKLTTELLNEPSCPHASIWTADRLKYFFTLENRFKIINIKENYNFDGRDLYLKLTAERL